MAGWIKLHKEIKNWEWYKDADTSRLFIHLLLGAFYEDGLYKGTPIKRGQLPTGRAQLAYELKLSEQKIRTSLSKLKLTNEITTKSTKKGTIITLCNYESYQDSTPESNQQKPRKDSRQVTTIEEDKEEKNKEEGVLELELFDSVLPFPDYWDMYDYKKGREDCEKIYSKISESDRAVIKETLPKYIASTPDKTYRLKPLKYLKTKAWNDEIIPRNNLSSQSNRKPGFEKNYRKNIF